MQGKGGGCEVQARASQWPSLGIQTDPPKRWWSLAVTTLKEAEIKALPLP